MEPLCAATALAVMPNAPPRRVPIPCARGPAVVIKNSSAGWCEAPYSCRTMRWCCNVAGGGDSTVVHEERICFGMH